MIHTIVTGSTIPDLQRVINTYIRDGWRPYGQYQVVVKRTHTVARRHWWFSNIRETNVYNELEYSQSMRKENEN